MARTRTSVKAAREASGLSQVEVSIRTGLSISTVRLAEAGLSTVRTRVAIADAIGVSLDELMGRSAGPSPKAA